MRADEQMHHYGEALDDVVKQMESSNAYKPNQLQFSPSYERLQGSGINGALDDGRVMSSN